MSTLTLDVRPDTAVESAAQTVARHIASTSLPASATAETRDLVQATWESALKTIEDQNPGWAIAYVPGVHFGDNETYALHMATGRVFGGDCPESQQGRGESTEAWLSRLAGVV